MQKDGWTSLKYASYVGNLEVARLLLEKGAEPDQADKVSAMSYSIRTPSYELHYFPSGVLEWIYFSS